MKPSTIILIVILLSVCFYVESDGKRTKRPKKGKHSKTTVSPDQGTTPPADQTDNTPASAAVTTTLPPSDTSPNSNNPTAAATTTLASNSAPTNGPDSGNSNPPPPPNGGGGSCQSAICNFEQGNPCSYQSADGKQWEVVQGKYKNLATGIRKADEGTYYVATYLKPYENATFKAPTNFDKDQEIKFLMYRITDKTELKGCCDDYTKCPFVTEPSINVADFNHWKPASFTCPKGTTQVIFRSSNSGGNEGAVGLDNIQTAC